MDRQIVEGMWQFIFGGKFIVEAEVQAQNDRRYVQHNKNDNHMRHTLLHIRFRTFFIFFLSVLYDENSHQLIHSRLRVWSALMLVGFMSNERFVHVWMNEWMNRMEIYVYVYTHSYIKQGKKVYLCRKVRYLMLYSDYVLRWIMVSYAWWTFSFLLRFWLCFQNVKVQK